MKKKSKIEKYTDQEALDYHNSGKSGKIHITEKTVNSHEETIKLTPQGEVNLKNKGSRSTFFLDDLD